MLVFTKQNDGLLITYTLKIIYSYVCNNNGVFCTIFFLITVICFARLYFQIDERLKSALICLLLVVLARLGDFRVPLRKKVLGI